MSKRNSMIAALLSFVMVFAMMPLLGQVYADDYVLYADAVSDNGVVYHDGDTVEIPQGEKVFLEFVTDFDRNKDHGASNMVGFSDGYEEGTLTKNGFSIKADWGDKLGYESTSFGIEIDTAGLEVGKTGELFYYVYEDADPVDFITTPHKGDWKLNIKVGKAANTFNVKGKTPTVKFSKLKKKTQYLPASKLFTFVNKGQGTRKYTLYSAKKGSKSFKKSFKINATTGKLTVKKGLKKGTYTVKVKVKANGDSGYNASALKTVTIKVKVK